MRIGIDCVNEIDKYEQKKDAGSRDLVAQQERFLATVVGLLKVFFSHSFSFVNGGSSGEGTARRAERTQPLARG